VCAASGCERHGRRLAGYSGTATSIRQAAYRALRTTKVTDLLGLASVEAGGGDDGNATDAGINRKITKLIRSPDPNVALPDPNVALKAIETRGKRETASRERSAKEPQHAGPDEVAIGFLELFPDARGAAIVGVLLGHAQAPPPCWVSGK
jgi:hypothetical protein